MMLQTTSLASIVTLIDITGAARTVNAQYYLPFEAYITAGVFYLCLTFILVRLFKLAERRWLATWPRGSTDMERIDHHCPGATWAANAGFRCSASAVASARPTSRPACTPMNCRACAPPGS
jgi:hypothetical protein